MKKLISFQIKAEKGFFKKPDINDGMYLTYNMLHKPAVLGILGAIVGLEGYKKNGELPEYYKALKDILVGIAPLKSEKGTFQKTIITYNNTTGFASSEEGGNLMITEQTLIKPGYEIFLLLDTGDEQQAKLCEYIKTQQAVYLPYLGKNDYSLWWEKENVKEYDWEKVEDAASPFVIETVFDKNQQVLYELEHTESKNDDLFEMMSMLKPRAFMYFERLPNGFDEELLQYSYADYTYTSYELKAENKLNNIYCLDNERYVQLN